MLKLEHAPRLVLGVRSTDHLSESTAAFARASKRLKTLEHPPFDIKDLTSALSQLEGHASDALYFEYKVPANAALIDIDMSNRPADFPARRSLIKSIDHLMCWEWSDAKEQAKRVLNQTESEDLRDEALNVLAAASALLGDLDGGIGALKQAVQGEWNFALQQNLGVLALQSNPQLAAEQSTYWLEAAETASDRERALFFVLNMWSDLQTDETDEVEIPERIRESFRSALTEELSLSTFVFLGLFLARNDSHWMQEPANWVDSPYFLEDVGNMVLARAEGLDTFVEFLIEQSANSDPEVVQARDNLISEIVEVMLEQESTIGAAAVAIQFIEGGLPCDTLNNALLRPLAVQEVCLYLKDNDGEANDEFVDWLLEFQTFSDSFEDSNLIEFVRDLLVSATAIFTLGYIVGRNSDIGAMEETLNTVYFMSQRWGTRRRLNKPEVRRLATNVIVWADEAQQMIAKLNLLPMPDEKIQEFFQGLIEQEQQVRRMANFILEKN